MKHIILRSCLLFLTSCNVQPPEHIKICPQPEVINLTNSWTSQDQSHYTFNIKLCSYKFKEAVCLKRFTKTGTLQYQIICSIPNK